MRRRDRTWVGDRATPPPGAGTRRAARTSRRRCPSAGRAMPPGTSTLAVGNPSSAPPRPSPWTTMPRTWWWRPSSRAAPATSPAASRAADAGGGHGPGAVVFEAQPHHGRSRSAPPSRPGAPRCPCARDRSGSPPPPRPAGRRAPSHEDLEHEVLGRLVGPDLVEGHHHRAADPGRRQELELLVEVGEQQGGRLGAHHGRRVPVEGHHHGGEPPARRRRCAARPAARGGPGAPRRRPRW